MHKKLAVCIALVCIFAFAGAALAASPTYSGTVITYDGWLDQIYDLPLPPNNLTALLADTLIVVSNGHPTGAFSAAIQVYDYNGTYFGSTNFYVGAVSQASIPGQNYGWITLGDIVKRTTHAPVGSGLGEKFLFQISTTTNFPPVVEIKQVIYSDPYAVLNAKEAIWNSENFSTWTETSLGGKRANGVVHRND